MAASLVEVGIALAAIALAGLAANRVGLSVIPAYIVAGILVGPGGQRRWEGSRSSSSPTASSSRSPPNSVSSFSSSFSGWSSASASYWTTGSG